MEICIHNGDCGGCIYQEIPYREQVQMKGNDVQRIFKEKDLTWDEFLGVEGSPSQYEYRNKMEYTFGNEEKDGEMTLGMHRRGRFMSVLTVDHCQLVDPDFNLILRASLDFCNERKYPFYHKKSHKGLVRNLVLRKGVRTQELLVNIITASPANEWSDPTDEANRVFDEEGFVKMIKNLPLQNKVVGILHTFNDGLGDGVRCDEIKILDGRDYYMEQIMGLDFKVSAFSFFQTNVEAVERLYTEALSWIDDVAGKKVFDLFCGTGTITQAISQRAEEAIGVEIVEEAVEAAKENAILNGLSNCRFIAGDVLKVLDELAEKPDTIVVDPPRAGIAPKAMKKILDYGVKQILYISCNPKSMVDNLATAVEMGYRIRKLKVFDNFPMTRHVETVCLLTRISSM